MDAQTEEVVGPLSPDHLVVGQGIELTIPFKAREITAQSVIVGFRESKFILVAMPSREHKGLAVVPGTDVSARLVNDGTLVSFRAESIRAQFSPEPLLFIEYPRRATVVSLRNAERVKISFPVIVRMKSESERVNGEVIDLSEGGCAVELGPEAEDYQTGTELTLYLRIPGLSALKRIRGILRRVRCKREGGKVQQVILGIQHVYKSEEDDTREMVQRLVSSTNRQITAEDIGAA